MKKSFLILILSLPIVSYAQINDFYDFIDFVFYPIIRIIPEMLISIAFIVFVWGIIKYILANGEIDKKEARGIIVFGIIGLTVLIGMWAIVSFLQNDFHIGGIFSPGPSEPIINKIDIMTQ